VTNLAVATKIPGIYHFLKVDDNNVTWLMICNMICYI